MSDVCERDWGMQSTLQQSGGSVIVWIRKKELLALSEGIRMALDGQSFDPRDHKEGAFSILKMIFIFWRMPNRNGKMSLPKKMSIWRSIYLISRIS